MKFEDKILFSLKKKKRNEIDLRIVNKIEPKYFYLKENDLYLYIKNRLLFLKPAYLELLSIKEEDLMQLNSVSTKSHYIYGIINVVNSNNIVIFSNIDGNNDISIKLNLEFVDRYSLFSGQIVVLKGKNIGTNEFIVDCIQCIPLVDINSSQPTGPCKLRIISKEFKESDTENVDVLILIGVNVIKYKDQLESFVKANTSNRIVLVPILEDDISINVYPQVSDQNISNYFTVLSNPGELQLNGNLISFNTLDILSDLKKEEISYCKKTNVQFSRAKEDPCGETLFKNDHIERLCYHILFQKSYIPGIPDIKNIQYDFDSLSMRVCPDFYIIKSSLGAFKRKIGPTTIINIGQNRVTDLELV